MFNIIICYYFISGVSFEMYNNVGFTVNSNYEMDYILWHYCFKTQVESLEIENQIFIRETTCGNHK
jgi:hypothetical protein